MPTTDYAIQDVKGIKKVFNNASELNVEKFKNVPAFNIQKTTEFSEIFTSTEGLSGLKLTAESGTPDVNALGDGYSVTIISKRYTNALELTSTDRKKMRDNSVKVRNFLVEQQNAILFDASYNFFDQLVDVLNDAFDGNTYLTPQGLSLCNASHKWNSTTQTFDNTTTAVFSESAVEQAQIDGSNILSSDGKEMGISYDTIVVRKGSLVANLAIRLFAASITPTQFNDVNIWEGQFRIIELPILSSLFWFMLDTSKGMKSPIYRGVVSPAAMQEPIKQNNEAIRSNVEGFWSTGINNTPFNFYGGDGTV